jgi:hypothetical protein
MHAQVQQMQAINALDVSSWHRGPQPAENDLTARSTPGQQQEIDSRRGIGVAYCRYLAWRSLGAPKPAHTAHITALESISHTRVPTFTARSALALG